MTNTTSSSNRFHINFADKTIVGSKASFDKAGKGFGPIYEELARLISLYPDYGFEVKVPETRSAKPKQTYKGMDVPFMLDYCSAVDDEAFRSKLDLVRKFAKNTGKKVYPIAKRLFLNHFADFNFAKAKKTVAEYRANKMVRDAEAEAA